MTRTVLFYRDYHGFTGGHLTMWDYFQHVAAAPGFVPKVYFTPRSVRHDNPWFEHGVAPEVEWQPEKADALFLGGLDWLAVPETCQVPVVNLVQHVRHGLPGDARFPFLARRAFRISVSQEVDDAIAAHANGPRVTIANGVSLPPRLTVPEASKTDVLIAALKQPELGRAIDAALRAHGFAPRLLVGRLPRSEFLRELCGAHVAVVVPDPTEGFFLPALEAMALGAVVVCPDCVGNRSFCLPANSFMPSYDKEAIVRDALRALALPTAEAEAMRAAAVRTAQSHGSDIERVAFYRVLAQLFP